MYRSSARGPAVCGAAAMRTFVHVLATVALAAAWAGGAEDAAVSQGAALGLDQCIEMALEHNAGLMAAEEDVTAAHARERRAYAEFLPKVQVAGRYTHLDEDRTFAIEHDDAFYDLSINTAAWWSIAEVAGTGAANAAYDSRAVDPTQSFSRARAGAQAAFPQVQTVPLLGQNVVEASGVITQPLFTGGKIRSVHEMAKLGERIAQKGFIAQQDELVLGVTSAYLGAVAAREIAVELGRLRLRLETMRDKLVRLIDADSARVSARDVALVEVALAAAEHEVAGARRKEHVALAAVRMLIGLDGGGALELGGFPPPPDLDGLPLEACQAHALIARPELAQARLGVEARDQGVRRAKADYSPDLAAFGGYRYFSDDEDFANPTDDDEWFAGLALTFSVFEGFGRAAQVAEARSTLRKARHQRVQLRRLVRAQVAAAYYSLGAAERQVEAALRGAEKADELKEITIGARRYDIGTDYLRVVELPDEDPVVEYKEVPDVSDEVEAEVAAHRSRIAALAAEARRGIGAAALARAMGVRSLMEAQP